MEGWLTPIQKIALMLLVAGAVGGVIYTAITTWATDNEDLITTPNYTSSTSIVRQIETMV